ncbi:PD-(D/E)XK nuclease family protein [Patescibacteria group bacterium]|nr:PD-(D/E)XK nuclease family protein [Patescibacteria group bacterium]MBU1890677.1 PD-(D/E)XK nuclease family protein [Patescibacteria group bacterium]
MTQLDIFDNIKGIMKHKLVRLSPTTGLNLFSDCPRCFWLHYNEGIHRPRGIFPSLPGGMDLVIKDYMDIYRKQGALPPELNGKVIGKLMPDLELMNKWRNWRTGLEYEDKKIQAVLFGALDDCLLSGKKYIPLDYKTRGSAPRAGDSERYYQTQLDTYALMLSENGYETASYGYLLYYYPKTVKENGKVQFHTAVVEVSTDLSRAKKTFEDAVKLLHGPLPKKHSSCEYCTWNHSRNEFD